MSGQNLVDQLKNLTVDDLASQLMQPIIPKKIVMVNGPHGELQLSIPTNLTTGETKKVIEDKYKGFDVAVLKRELMTAPTKYSGNSKQRRKAKRKDKLKLKKLLNISGQVMKKCSTI